MKGQRKRNINSCSSCGVCSGTNYETSHLIPIGSSQLCEDCYADLIRKGFIYLGEKMIKKIPVPQIMKEDGNKYLISQKELNALPRKA